MPIDSAAAVKVAYDYLIKVSPNASRFSNFRLEEIRSDEQKNYILTLSYEITGDLGFDKQKEFKEFKVTSEGVVEWMKIRKV